MRTKHALAFALALGMMVTGAPQRVVHTTEAQIAGCQLAGGQIQHVIYIQFDNVHFRRDNPNVPSDLEQMPHLLDFILQNGTLLTNDHTVLMSHTATGILSSLTGVYPDRMGQPVSNSFGYFDPEGSTRTGVSFAYWTAPLFDPIPGQTDFTPTMINESGKIAPAPWVPFTRAGCDVGSVATANTILENTSIDVRTVFGATSPEAAEAVSNPPQAFTDFVGIGVHCAQGSSLCSVANHGFPDLLPDEPGGYFGYNALFGARYVNPAIRAPMLTDLDGKVIRDAAGRVGFPGFDGMLATVTLAWVAQMQEAGIPVTFAYISDAHDGHGTAGGIHFAYGPGETGYVQQLRDYDRAFLQFFARLSAGGVTKDNTLFVFTTDEGDHFVGDPPSPLDCDGVTTPCTYARVGEINTNLRGALAEQFGDSPSFSVHASVAPNVYVDGNPSRTDQAVRRLERQIGRLMVTNPYAGTLERIGAALADPVEQKALHLETADPFRTPTLTLFGDQNYFFFAAEECIGPCVSIPPRGPRSFAWSHGGIQEEIASTWVGFVGPGIRNLPSEDVATIWTDHTDMRPTILMALGLVDAYETDGRAVIELLSPRAMPPSLVPQRETFIRLSAIYKQINAPFGRFGLDTLQASTRALLSGSDDDDSVYTATANAIASLTSDRDALARAIRQALNATEFGGISLDEQRAQGWIEQAQRLLDQAAVLAARK